MKTPSWQTDAQICRGRELGWCQNKLLLPKSLCILGEGTMMLEQPDCILFVIKQSNEVTLNNAKIIEWKKKTLRGPGDITQPPHSQIYFQKSKEIVTMQARLSDISVVHTGRMTSWWSPLEVRSRAKEEDKLRASRDPWCYLRILQGMRQGWGRPTARLTMLALPLFSFSSHFDLMARGQTLPEG